MSNIPLTSIVPHRLCSQQIVSTRFTTPGEVVSWLGAVQAQDYWGALWSVGLRLPGTTQTAIEQAIADRILIRTWPMRGTLHFLAAQDVRWMLALLTPRTLATSALRCQRLGLDKAQLVESYQALTAALQGGKPLPRLEVIAVLERAGIATGSQRGYHILWQAAQEGLICLGPMNGKQQTFVLLEEWLPPGKTWTREEALAELARRYFTSHGPATLQDFMWWTGLIAADARAALTMASSHLAQEQVAGRGYWRSSSEPKTEAPDGSVYLLPGFDEYLLGYKDRSAVLDPVHVEKILPGGNGVFMPTLVVDGKVAGTWKRTITRSSVSITLSPFTPLSKAQRDRVAVAAEGYGRFLALPVQITFQSP